MMPCLPVTEPDFVLTVRLNMAAGFGMRIGSGSRLPSFFFHRIRTRLAGWETLSASFRTANERTAGDDNT